MTFEHVLLFVVGFLLLAHAPTFPVIRILTMQTPDKAAAVACMLGAWIRGMLILPADLLAPVVTPFALLFTGWEADRLPKLFRWWDNDVSLNGDVRQQGLWALEFVPIADTPEARAMCYWAPGHHPRSFYARWIWIGLRNRASRLAQIVGTAEDGDQYKVIDGNASLTRVGSAWCFYWVKQLGPVLIRIKYGYKVPRIPGWDRAPVVTIGFSMKRAS